MNYQNVAIIVTRGVATSFLFSAMIEIGIIASDILFVKTGIYAHSEIAFQPRLMSCAFYFLASMFLFTQSKMIAKIFLQGLFGEKASDENENESKIQDDDADERQ